MYPIRDFIFVFKYYISFFGLNCFVINSNTRIYIIQLISLHYVSNEVI